MKKRGDTHVGVVLSFVIFITFLIFVYTILIQPAISQTSKQSVLENLKIKLTDEISGELTVATINIEDKPQNCIRLSNLITDIGVNSNIIVKDKLGVTQTSYDLSNDLEISRDNSDDTFFKVYHSNEFSALSTTGETLCTPTTYTKGLVRTSKYIFESKILNLMNDYETNYETIKNNLEIHSSSNFGLGFRYGNGTSIRVPENLTTNIYALEIPSQYISKDSDIKLGFLNIRVW